MADDAKKAKKEPEAAAGESGGEQQQQEQQQQQQQQQRQAVQLQVNDANAIACYANFCRVTGTPEELIIDFGLNPQPVGIPRDPIEVKQRIIVNFFTAKRLLAALSASVQRHEAIFGVLETDIQKRLRPQIQAAQQQQAAAQANQ